MTTIKILKQSLTIKPVNFFFGEEMLVNKACQQARENLVPPAREAFNYQVCCGSEMKLGAVLENMQGLPLGQGDRLVIIKELDDLDGSDREWEVFWQILKDPPPGLIYIFAQPGSPDKRFAIFKGLLKLAGSQGDFSFKPWEKETILEPFIETEVNNQGKKIDPLARRILAESFSEDLGVLVSEITKIATFIGERPVITEADLVAASPRLRGDFALAEAIGRKDLAQSLMIVEEMLGQGVYPNILISQLASAVRGLLQAKIARKNNWSGAAAAKNLGVNPGFLSHYEAQSEKFTASALRKMLIDLHEADAAIKTGRQDGAVIIPAIVAGFCAG